MADCDLTENLMRKIPIGIALALLMVAAGCQTSTPTYQFSCRNYHAIDAGLCDDPNSGRLVGALLHQDYRGWGY
jgi:hypothetical protein